MGGGESKNNVEPGDNPDDSMDSTPRVEDEEEQEPREKVLEDNILGLEKQDKGGGVTLTNKDPNNYSDEKLLKISLDFYKSLTGQKHQKVSVKAH